MQNCPQCGALAVLFADGEKNDLTALGLRCAHHCGWQLTMEDQQNKIEQLRYQRDLFASQLLRRWCMPGHVLAALTLAEGEKKGVPKLSPMLIAFLSAERNNAHDSHEPTKLHVAQSSLEQRPTSLMSDFLPGCNNDEDLERFYKEFEKLLAFYGEETDYEDWL